MVQDIFTYIIIAASFGYALFSLCKMVFPLKKNNAVHCAGCAGCQLKTSRDLSYS
jgi:hypothetical protein